MELMTKHGYKQTELGLIPEEWEIEKFKDVTNAITCGVAATPEYVSESLGMPFLSASHVQKGKVVPNKIKYITKDLYRQITKNNKPEKGDILYTRVGAGIGEAGVIDFELDFAIYVSLTLIKPKRILNNYFLRSLLNSNYYKFLAKNGQFAGGGVQNLNVEVVREFPIPIPTLIEQKAIATALSDVDALITSLEQSLTKKKAIKQGAMQALLNGKIRLNGFGETKTMKESEFGLIPEDWDVKLLPEVFDYIHGKAHEQHIDSTGIFTVVNSKFISTEGKVTKYSKENFCSARKGDILTVLSDLPNGKALAKTYYVNTDNKYAVNQRICIWRSKKDSPLFLSFIMNRHKYFMKFDDGVTQTHILNHHIEKCPVLVPRDLNEQTAIGQILSDMDTEITQLETKKEKYQAIKQGMMQELLTGKTRLI